MATAPNFVPVEEYLRTSYSPDAEYIDGQIVERESTMGENDHSAWSDAICAWFREQAKKAGIRVRPEFRVQVDAYCFLVPDEALIDRNRPVEPVATQPPVAVFEILSPGDSLKRLMKKGERYEKMGIRTILVLDPDRPAYRFLGGRLGRWRNARSRSMEARRASIWTRLPNWWIELRAGASGNMNRSAVRDSGLNVPVGR